MRNFFCVCVVFDWADLDSYRELSPPPFLLFSLLVHCKEMPMPTALVVHWQEDGLPISQSNLVFLFILDFWCILSSLGKNTFEILPGQMSRY